MNFTVDWDEEAQNDLMAVWLAAPDQLAVTRASAAIDQILADDPFEFGQYLSEELWRLRLPPIVVHYAVDSVRRHVEVTAVARTI
jgi:mRNA-degrading endonuclease RelE of RelBE toxin-antitoxin system